MAMNPMSLLSMLLGGGVSGNSMFPRSMAGSPVADEEPQDAELPLVPTNPEATALDRTQPGRGAFDFLKPTPQAVGQHVDSLGGMRSLLDAIKQAQSNMTEAGNAANQNRTADIVNSIRNGGTTPVGPGMGGAMPYASAGSMPASREKPMPDFVPEAPPQMPGGWVTKPSLEANQIQLGAGRLRDDPRYQKLIARNRQAAVDEEDPSSYSMGVRGSPDPAKWAPINARRQAIQAAQNGEAPAADANITPTTRNYVTKLAERQAELSKRMLDRARNREGMRNPLAYQQRQMGILGALGGGNGMSDMQGVAAYGVDGWSKLKLAQAQGDQAAADKTRAQAQGDQAAADKTRAKRQDDMLELQTAIALNTAGYPQKLRELQNKGTATSATPGGTVGVVEANDRASDVLRGPLFKDVFKFDPAKPPSIADIDAKLTFHSGQLNDANAKEVADYIQYAAARDPDFAKNHPNLLRTAAENHGVFRAWKTHKQKLFQEMVKGNDPAPRDMGMMGP